VVSGGGDGDGGGGGGDGIGKSLHITSLPVSVFRDMYLYLPRVSAERVAGSGCHSQFKC
jgi:hypothetical protein